MIEDGIDVERTVEPARIEGVDRTARTLQLRVPGFRLCTYKVEPGALDRSDVEIGDRVRATIEEALTVYVAPGPQNEAPDARVLVVDPSYRLLTVQYRNGRTEIFKVGLHTRMNGIEAGDSVVIRPVEVIEIRVKGHRKRQETSRSSPAPTLAR